MVLVRLWSNFICQLPYSISVSMAVLQIFLAMPHFVLVFLLKLQLHLQHLLEFSSVLFLYGFVLSSPALLFDFHFSGSTSFYGFVLSSPALLFDFHLSGSTFFYGFVLSSPALLFDFHFSGSTFFYGFVLGSPALLFDFHFSGSTFFRFSMSFFHG